MTIPPDHAAEAAKDGAEAPPLPPDGQRAGAARWLAPALLWGACAAVFGAWLAEEWRDVARWAAQRGVDPLDYGRALPAAAARQWAEAGRGWAFPWGSVAGALVAILWMVGTHALGDAVLRRCLGRGGRGADRHGAQAYPRDTWLGALALPVGMAIAGTGVLMLGVVGWLDAWLFRALVVVAAVLGAATRLRAAACMDATARAALRRRLLHPANIAVVALAALAFVAALAPATESDGLRYHLGALSEWTKAGRIEFLPHLSFAQFPFLVEMHFLVGLVVWGDPVAGGITAKVMHWCLFVASLWLLAELTRRCAARHGPHHATAGARLARLAYASMPTALVLAGWSFIDHGIVLFFLAMALALDEARRALEGEATPRRAIAWGAVAGVMAGGLAATKYTMLAPAGVGGAWLVLACWRARRDLFVGVIGAGALGAALVAGPWFAKNAMQCGNPIYPATGGVFDAPGWPAESADLLRAQMATKGWIGDGTAAHRASWWGAWWHVSTHWRAFEAQCLGPGFALAILVGAGWVLWSVVRRARTPRDTARALRAPDDPAANAISLARLLVLLGATFYALWFATYLSARQLLPLAAVLCVVPGALFAHCRGSARGAIRILAAHLAIAWWLVALSGAAFAVHWFVVGQYPSPLPVALGFERPTRYLTRALNYYPLALELGIRQRADGVLGRPDSAGAPRALLLGEHRPFYFDGPILFADWFNPPLIGELIASTPDTRALLERLRDEGVSFIAFNEAELSLYAPLFARRLGERGAARFDALMQRLFTSARLPTPAADSAVRLAGLAEPPPLWLFSVEQALAGEAAAQQVEAAETAIPPSPENTNAAPE